MRLLFDKKEPKNAQLDNATQQMTSNFFFTFLNKHGYTIALVTPAKTIFILNLLTFPPRMTTLNFYLGYVIVKLKICLVMVWY